VRQAVLADGTRDLFFGREDSSKSSCTHCPGARSHEPRLLKKEPARATSIISNSSFRRPEHGLNALDLP